MFVVGVFSLWLQLISWEFLHLLNLTEDSRCHLFLLCQIPCYLTCLPRLLHIDISSRWSLFSNIYVLGPTSLYNIYTFLFSFIGLLKWVCCHFLDVVAGIWCHFWYFGWTFNIYHCFHSTSFFYFPQ